MTPRWIERLGRSNRAREKFADHLMAARTGLSVVLFASVSVTAMVGVANRMLSGAVPLTWQELARVVDRYPVEMGSWLTSCMVAFWIIFTLGKTAAEIYDSIESNESDRAKLVRRRAKWSR